MDSSTVTGGGYAPWAHAPGKWPERQQLAGTTLPLEHPHHVRGPGREGEVGFRFAEDAELVAGGAGEAEAVEVGKASVGAGADHVELQPRPPGARASSTSCLPPGGIGPPSRRPRKWIAPSEGAVCGAMRRAARRGRSASACGRLGLGFERGLRGSRCAERVEGRSRGSARLQSPSAACAGRRAGGVGARVVGQLAHFRGAPASGVPGAGEPPFD